MSVLKTFLASFITGIIFTGIDFIWLSIMTSRLYKPQLAGYMADRVNILPAVLFYILFTIGLMVLAVFPAVDRGSLIRAVVFSGLLGLIAYATYDLTNLSSIKNWPLIITVVDIAWGTTLAAISGALGYLVTRALG